LGHKDLSTLKCGSPEKKFGKHCSKPFTLQGATTYGGSLQRQGTTSQFASGSPSSYPIVTLSSPQGSASHSAAVQSSQKRFTSTFMGNSGTQEGPSGPFKRQGSTTYGGSLQLQGTTSQFASGSPSYPSVSLFSPQGASSQSAAVQSSRKQFASSYATQSGSSKPFTVHTSRAYSKLGSSSLAVSSQSTSDKQSNGLYSSDSLQTQGLIGVIKRSSRLSSQAPDSTSSNQIAEHFGAMQRPTGLNLTPSLGLSAQGSSVGLFSGIPQTAHSLRESGSDVQLNNQPFLKKRYSVKG